MGRTTKEITPAYASKEEQRLALCRPFAVEDLKTREQGGAQLMYLEGYTVLQRLNEVMKGDYEFQLGPAYVTDKTVDVPGTLTLRWCDGTTTVVSDFGSSDVLYSGKGGRINDPFKSAVKDLWKRCLAIVGVGADLYDAEYRELMKQQMRAAEEAEAERAFLTCQDCSGAIEGGTVSTPKGDIELDARKVATSTRQKFGVRLCIACANKRREG